MDVGSPLPANPQPAMLMKPAERALDDPTLASESGAVLGLLAGDQRPDAPLPHEPAVVVVVVAAIAHNRVGATTRPAHPAADAGDGVEQRDELGDVVAVAARQADRERDAARIGQEVML